MTELLDVVNDANEVVGEASVDWVYQQKLNHRIVHVLVFNDKGEIFLHQLSANQTFCPGHWSTSAGGHVQKGEGYAAAAKRELENTLGVELPLIRIHEGHYDHYKMRKFLEIFRGISPGPFHLNPRMAAAGRWFSVADVKDMVRKNQLVHPELAHVIEKLYP